MNEQVTQQQNKSSQSVWLYSTLGIFIVIVIVTIILVQRNNTIDNESSTSNSSTATVTENDVNQVRITNENQSQRNDNISREEGNSPNETQQETSTETSTQNSNSYNNGTYTQTGSYTIPNGEVEEISVQLTLENDTISSVTVTGNTSIPLSIRNQELFKEGISGVVVGKSIEDADVSIINGSSLTGRGFNEALDKIKSEARK